MNTDTFIHSWRGALKSLAATGSALSLFAGLALAQQPTWSNFEGLTPNTSVNGQGGWLSSNPAWDEEVVDDGSGNLVWRVSNEVTSGAFGNMPFAPATDLYAGESGSMHVFDGAGPVTNRFFASFDFWSVTGAAQPGLDITISPDDGAGARQSFISIEDNGAGIDIEFFDTAGNHALTNPNGGFFSTDVVTGLSYGTVHNVAFDITFVDGNVIDLGGNVFGNDIVKIFVDGVLVHTGTTWESYWWTTTEGQVPPSSRAVDTLLFRLSTPAPGMPPTPLLGQGFYFDNVLISTKCPEDFQGFETDVMGWQVFSSPIFFPTRVPSGTNGVPSATGGFHAIASAMSGEVPAGNWGGYGGNCDCASSSCAVGEFPEHGYTTAIDVYLDMAGGWADDTRFDFSSAINQPDGFHRRDFIFNAGFYGAGDATLPGTGTDRYIISASNNSGQPPFNPPAMPVAVTTTGWYTFEHRFYSLAGNVLAVEMTVTDTSGLIVGQWTLSDASDIIGTTVGANRYAWFPTNDFDDLAFDNATRFAGGTAELALTVADCQDDANGAPGYQVEVELEMLNLTSLASGFQAFVEYPMGTLIYRGDLSSYTGSPFSLHISPINQGDDGLLELDGTVAFGGIGTTADSLLATLVFDVVATCVPTVLGSFEVGGAFPSELSYLGAPLGTTLTDSLAVTLDDTPPVLTPCPADITQSADAGSCTGAVVTWTDPTATDTCDPAPTVVCSPLSGSTFAIGTTTVTCTATDTCGNTSSCTFDVTVTATNDVDVVVQLTGSDPTSRCIMFQTDSCSSFSDATLTFVGMAPAVATVTIQVPCGVWTQLSAKDEQHSQWDTTALTISGANYVASTTLVLGGGDTDNDGDVDINDVTQFLAQFGNLASAGGCPWDGVTADADFSNNGAVGAEDYTFLATNWLTASSSACFLAVTGGGGGTLQVHSVRVSDALTAAADLTGDGRVDVRDVELFEQQYGLSGALSKRMRATNR